MDSKDKVIKTFEEIAEVIEAWEEFKDGGAGY